MKKRNMILLRFAVLLIAGFARATDVSALTLGEKDGLTGECDVRGYDAEKETVRVMIGGSVTNFPLNSLRPQTQSKIIKWAEDKSFLSSSDLSIKVIEKFDIQNKAKDEPDRSIKVFENGRVYEKKIRSTQVKDMEIVYEVTLKNKTPIEIKNAAITYRIFYKEKRGMQDQQRDGKCFVGSRIVTIAPNDEVTFSTTPVIIRDRREGIAEIKGSMGSSSPEDYTGPSYYPVQDQLQGLHLELSKPGWDGKVVERVVKDGSVPGESSWDDYEGTQTTVQKGFSRKKDSSSSSQKSPSANIVWDEATLEKSTRAAENGSVKAAYMLYLQYRKTGDTAKRKQWADKIREIARENPDDPMAAKILAIISKTEAASAK